MKKTKMGKSVGQTEFFYDVRRWMMAGLHVLRCMALAVCCLVGSSVVGASAPDYRELIAAGDSCMEVFNVFEAMRFYGQARQLNDDNAVKMRLADCYYQRADYRRCADLLKVVGEDSLTHDAFRELFYCYYFRKDYASATFWGSQLVGRFPLDGQMVAELAAACNMEDQPDLAIRYAMPYYRRDSANYLVNRQLAYAHFYNRNYPEAARLYDRLLSLGDSAANTLYLGGMCHEQLEDYPQARTLFLASARLADFKQPTMLYHLGSTCHALKRYEEAYDYLVKAENLLKPDSAVVRNIRLLLAEMDKRDTKYKDAVIHVMDSLYLIGRYAEANKAFASLPAGARRQLNQWEWYNGACVAAKAGDRNASFARLNRVLEKNPVWQGGLEDKDLVSLHADARWTAFATEVNKRKAAAERFFDIPLRNRLLRIGRADQEPRAEWRQAVASAPADTARISRLLRQMAVADAQNEREVCAILDSCGWVGRGRVGDACRVLWTVIQHSSVENMKKYFPLFAVAAAGGDLDLEHLALMQDRIDMFEGRPQRYGTQIEQRADGKAHIYKLLDKSLVDTWRRQMGLSSLALYAERMKALVD